MNATGDAPVSPPVSVVRLGGSLLDRADLFDRLTRLLLLLGARRLLFMTGGGASADTIRRLDRQFGLPPAAAHEAAIDAMSSNARLLSRLDRRFAIVRDRSEAESEWQVGRVPVLDSRHFLMHRHSVAGELSLPTLPESWDVTSDSIAAWVALAWPASEVVLAKSCELCEPDAASATLAGRVDAFLPELLRWPAAANLTTRWINMAADELVLRPLAGSRCPE